MQIKTVTLKDFKGINRSFDLAPMTLICGSNRSGKSAIRQAITWAITGGTETGARNEDTARYLGARGGSVGITFDDGSSFVRRLDVGRNTMKQSLEGTIFRGSTTGLRARQGVLTERLGNVPAMFDVRQFLRLSPDKARDFLLSLCMRSLPTVKPEELSRTCAEAVSRAFEMGQMENDVRAHLGVLYAPFWRMIQPIVSAFTDAGDMQSALLAASEAAKAEASQSHTVALAKREAAASIIQRQREITVAAKTIAQMGRELDELSEERTQARESLAASKAAADALAALERQHASFIEAEDKAQGESSSSEAFIETKQQEIVNHGNMIGPLPDEFDVELLQAASQAIDDAKNALADARKDHERLSAELNDVNAGGNDWNDALELLEKLFPDGPGPKQDNDYSTLASFIRSRCVTKLADKALDELCNRMLFAESEVANRASTEQSQLERLRSLQAERDARSATLREIGARNLEAHAAMRRLSDEIARLEAASDRLTTAVEARLQAEAELGTLRSSHVQIDTDTLDSTIQRCGDRIVELTDERSGRERYDLLTEEYDKCVADADALDSANRVAKAILGGVRELRETIMAQLAAPFLRHLAHVGITPFLDFGQDGKSRFDLGLRIDDERETAFQTLSGSEQAVFAACVNYAICQMAAPPLQLLFCEAAECEPTVVNEMIGYLAAAPPIAGNVLIFVWTRDWRELPEGWETIDLDISD